MNKKSTLIYGIRAVIEAVKSGQHLERVFVLKNLKGDLYKELMLHLHQTSTPISKVPIERINKFTSQNHQGVIAFVSPIQYYQLEHIVPQLFEDGKNPLLLILNEVTDIRNFGAIARTAECLGVDALVIPSHGGAQVNEDSIKTSAGAFSYLPVCREDNLQESIRFLQESGINIISCSEKANQELNEVNFMSPCAIIMGSEEHGISSELIKLSNKAVKVPITGSIESLNVSVAAGVILYEVQTQRKVK